MLHDGGRFKRVFDLSLFCLLLCDIGSKRWSSTMDINPEVQNP